MEMNIIVALLLAVALMVTITFFVWFALDETLK
jgi:capsular polysaccharide biosynthesis protein